MIERVALVALTLAALTAATPAEAGYAYSCVVPVSRVAVALDGSVAFSRDINGGLNPVCNLSHDYTDQVGQTVTVEACQGMLSLLQTAYVTGRKIMIVQGHSVPDTCDDNAIWTTGDIILQ